VIHVSYTDPATGKTVEADVPDDGYVSYMHEHVLPLVQSLKKQLDEQSEDA
jgi:hypothetical protein